MATEPKAVINTADLARALDTGRSSMESTDSRSVRHATCPPASASATTRYRPANPAAPSTTTTSKTSFLCNRGRRRIPLRRCAPCDQGGRHARRAGRRTRRRRTRSSTPARPHSSISASRRWRRPRIVEYPIPESSLPRPAGSTVQKPGASAISDGRKAISTIGTASRRLSMSRKNVQRFLRYLNGVKPGGSSARGARSERSRRAERDFHKDPDVTDIPTLERRPRLRPHRLDDFDHACGAVGG